MIILGKKRDKVPDEPTPAHLFEVCIVQRFVQVLVQHSVDSINKRQRYVCNVYKLTTGYNSV